MSSPENPFSSPSLEASQVQAEPLAETPGKIVRATQGNRFANYAVDMICLRILQEGLGFCLGFAVAVYAEITRDESVFELLTTPVVVLISLVMAFFYFFTQEALFGRTLGKLATGTKVVDEDGNHPTVGQIAGRTLSRFIPFDPFSFLSAGPPRGWHDSLSGTYVVKVRR